MEHKKLKNTKISKSSSTTKTTVLWVEDDKNFEIKTEYSSAFYYYKKQSGDYSFKETYSSGKLSSIKAGYGNSSIDFIELELSNGTKKRYQH